MLNSSSFLGLSIPQMSCVFVFQGAGSKSEKEPLLDGPPDANQILCCEVCGKYGLPQDFSASGRFCGLSCVGVYTGRRNKGREFVRNTSTVDYKSLKKKKKSKGKKSLLSKVPNAIRVVGKFTTIDTGFHKVA